LSSGSCELRTMSRPSSEYPDDVTVYLVVNDFGSLGRAFVQTDIAEADRETVIRDFLSGQYSNALRVVAFNTAEGWSRDVSEDIAGECSIGHSMPAKISRRTPSGSSTGT
jgi:hypothetical protein